jgi:hypothetical protein
MTNCDSEEIWSTTAEIESAKNPAYDALETDLSK